LKISFYKVVLFLTNVKEKEDEYFIFFLSTSGKEKDEEVNIIVV